MKSSPRLTSLLGAITLTLLATMPFAEAQTLYWSGTAGDPIAPGGGAWNLSDLTWSTTTPAPTLTTWINSPTANAIFEGTPGGTVSILQDSITVGTITFNTASTFVITDENLLSVNGGIINAGAGLQTIENSGNLELLGAATITPGAGGINLVNGVSFDISGTSAPTVTLTSLTNSIVNPNDPPNLLPGQVLIGKKTLALGALTLAATDGDELTFSLTAPGDAGKITISGGAFLDPDAGFTTIDFAPPNGAAMAGTYDLIDFTLASSSVGFSGNPYDHFVLGTLPQGLVGATLVYGGFQNQVLQLVAVPEPATMMMPLAAVLGLVWLRRRTARTA